MVTKIYFEHVRELGGIRLLGSDKFVVGPALVPADGNEYPLSIFGLSLQYFNLNANAPDEEFQKVETIEDDLVIYVSWNGLIKVEQVGGKRQAPLYVKEGQVFVTEQIRSLTEAQALALLLRALYETQHTFKYSNIVDVLEYAMLTHHLPYVVKTCYNSISFEHNILGMHDISIDPEGIATYCLVDQREDYLRGLNFNVADGLVYITEMREETTRYSLAIDGASKHIQEFGIGLHEVRSVLPQYLYHSTGHYAIQLGPNVTVTIDALGIIKANTIESTSKIKTTMAIAKDGSLHYHGLNLLQRPEELETLIIYTLLTSFNTANRRELKEFMESRGLGSKYDYVLFKTSATETLEPVER